MRLTGFGIGVLVNIDRAPALPLPVLSHVPSVPVWVGVFCVSHRAGERAARSSRV